MNQGQSIVSRALCRAGNAPLIHVGLQVNVFVNHYFKNVPRANFECVRDREASPRIFPAQHRHLLPECRSRDLFGIVSSADGSLWLRELYRGTGHR